MTDPRFQTDVLNALDYIKLLVAGREAEFDEILKLWDSPKQTEEAPVTVSVGFNSGTPIAEPKGS